MVNCGWRHVWIVCPFFSFSLWTSRVVWFTGCIGFPRSYFTSNGSHRHCLFLKNSRFQIRKGPHDLILLLLRQVSPLLCPTTRQGMHLAAAGVSVGMSVPGPLDAIGLFADEELVGTCEDRFIAVAFDFATLLSSPFCSCILFRHRVGAAYQAGILSAASRAEMADVEQMKKIVPFVTCETTFSQYVCELVFGVNVSNWILESRLNLSNNQSKATLGFLTHVSLWTSAFYYHCNHGFIVLKDIQHSIGTRMCSAWWNVINIGQIDWCAWLQSVSACLVECLPTGFPVALLHLWFCWFGLVRNEVLQSLNPKDRVREAHPCVNLHREKWFQLL